MKASVVNELRAASAWRDRGARPSAAQLAVVLVALLLAPVPPASATGPDQLAEIAAAVSDTVVNISATQVIAETRTGTPPKVAPGTPFDDLFEEFFRRQRQGDQTAPRQRERKSSSLGSGFVVDASGIVITNNHVIADAQDITVIFTDGQKLKAEVVGKDSKVDVAVLKVKPDKPLKAARFGDSEAMRVGDWVVAVGNPFGLGGTVTAGIISARNRNIDSGPYDNYFQTDAAINKGNSGGPLFNLAGEVIGINTAILSPTGGSIGIGFATPAATVVPVIDQLQKYGETRRGWLGVRIQHVDETIAESLDLGAARGALVAGTNDKGPAQAAGLLAGDVIVEFDGVEIKDSRDLPKIVAAAPVGKDVEVQLIRQGKHIVKTVKLGRLEDNERKVAAAGRNEPSDKSFGAKPAPRVFGMELARLTEDARQKFSIKGTVSAGVVVTAVAPDSAAAQKRIRPGEVILEVDQAPVSDPGDVAEKVQTLRGGGKKSALLLVANSHGEVRFVALALPRAP
jgi:serine protease Do